MIHQKLQPYLFLIRLISISMFHQSLSSSPVGTLNKHLPCMLTIFLALTLVVSAAVPGSASREAIVSTACKATFYQTACQSALLSSTKGAAGVSQTHADLFDLSVQFSLNQAIYARAHVHDLMLINRKTRMARGSDDCMELLDDTINQLTNVVNRRRKTLMEDPDDVRTWLSASLTNQATCLESIQTFKNGGKDREIRSMAQNLTFSISNSLALYKSTKPSKAAQRTNTAGHHRRLLSGRFPGWVTTAERKLLEASVEEIGATAVVAQDGSGTHKTIGEALSMAVTLSSEGRTVIHVKAGTYKENLKIPSSQKNVMLVGDGKGKTVIVGHKNYVEGSTTYNSATVGKKSQPLKLIFKINQLINFRN